MKTEKIGDDYEMYYRYDTNGVLASVTRYTVSTASGSILYAQTNTRGDVTSLYDGNGATRAKYVYDSWGKLISATDGNGNALAETAIGSLNSIRYRGYVYDSETGLYYLQSRYYDPEVGRFINADSVDYIGYSGETLSYNMFAYCENNGVNCKDCTGRKLVRGVGVSYMRNLILSFITFLFQLISFFLTYDFLQTMFNKVFRSDLYVLIIFVLLVVMPIVVFLLSIRIFYKKSSSKNIIKNIVYSDIYLFIFGVLYYHIFLEYDADFTYFALWIHIFWTFLVSVALIVYYKIGVNAKKTDDGSPSSDEK